MSESGALSLNDELLTETQLKEASRIASIIKAPARNEQVTIIQVGFTKPQENLGSDLSALLRGGK